MKNQKMCFASVTLFLLLAGTQAVVWGFTEPPKDTLPYEVWHGNLANVQKMLNQNPKLADVIDKNGETPLMGAVRKGHLPIVQYMIGKGISPNTSGKLGGTPLMSAVDAEQNKIAEYLITNGAKVNAQNESGLTPLHIATLAGRSELAKLLVDKGANLNIQDKNGKTPLATAATNWMQTISFFTKERIDKRNEDCLQIAKYLVAKGANVNIKDNKGKTALDYAMEGQLQQIAEQLQQHGARHGNEIPSVGQGEIGLSGTISNVDTEKKILIISVTSFTLPNGNSTNLSPAKPKTVMIEEKTSIHASGDANQKVELSDVKVGSSIIVVGKDTGSGQILSARELIIVS